MSALWTELAAHVTDTRSSGTLTTSVRSADALYTPAVTVTVTDSMIGILVR